MIKSLYTSFQRWSKKGSIYILSDTHFDDDDCVKMHKKWITPEEQIDIINSMVHKNDTFIHLGDVGTLEYIKKIKGYKVLIMGNHDDGPKSKYEEIFDEIYEGPLLIGEKILLSHEPIHGLSWCLNIHGHDHTNISKDMYHLNLSANLCDFTPISLGKYIKTHGLRKIKSLHRKTINKATSNKK